MKVLQISAKSLATVFLVLFALTAVSFGQQSRSTPSPTLVINKSEKEMPVAARNNLYCAGYIQTAPVNTDFEVVGASNEREQNVYTQGEYLYVNRGTNAGVKIGDKFSVIRPRGRFTSRFSNKGNLGIYVQEVGAVEVIKVNSEVSVARATTSCDNFLLGDLLEPIPERISPLFQPRPGLDLFGEPSGKAQGRIVMARDGREALTAEQIVYIDLGNEDSVKVGDYFTIYRPLGKGSVINSDQPESLSSSDSGFRSKVFGDGGFSIQAPRRTSSEANGNIDTRKEAKSRRPAGIRKVVGELVVLNVKERTATALITRNAQEIHPGDSVELQ